ncbi:MAG: polysaccharide biosynthesis C-terminal domain-containing protein, partial [Oscillospiraceae bacterium]|nr:polysaccharide biosynthesis C-terminal domain-containing protein [Oscillospiraceae bacterium]
QILLPQGKDWCFTLAVSCGAAIDLILNALLMPKYGCNGAALATLVAEFVQMSIQFYFAREFLFCSFDFKCSVKVLSSSFLAIIILLIFPGFDAIHAPMLNMFLSACIYFFSYLIILIIFREKLLISFFSDIGGQIMSKTKK